MAINSVMASEKVVWLANMLSTSDLGPLLNETSLDEAFLNETLLIESLLTETVSGVVRDFLFPNSHIRRLLDLLVLGALCDDEESARRRPDRAEEPEELRAMGTCAGLPAPPRTPAIPEKEGLGLGRLPGREFGKEGLLDQEAFELLRIVSITEYITYMNALNVCSE
jgi:hypothetical protein